MSRSLLPHPKSNILYLHSSCHVSKYAGTNSKIYEVNVSQIVAVIHATSKIIAEPSACVYLVYMPVSNGDGERLQHKYGR